MTEQEAITYINQKICCEKPVQRFCRDKCLYGKNECAFSLATDALEKQIPKKPKETSKWGTFFNCVDCGRDVEKEYHNYCPRCGQRLDWGEP